MKAVRGWSAALACVAAYGLLVPACASTERVGQTTSARHTRGPLSAVTSRVALDAWIGAGVAAMNRGESVAQTAVGLAEAYYWRGEGVYRLLGDAVRRADDLALSVESAELALGAQSPTYASGRAGGAGHRVLLGVLGDDAAPALYWWCAGHVAQMHGTGRAARDAVVPDVQATLDWLRRHADVVEGGVRTLDVARLQAALDALLVSEGEAADAALAARFDALLAADTLSALAPWTRLVALDALCQVRRASPACVCARGAEGMRAEGATHSTLSSRLAAAHMVCAVAAARADAAAQLSAAGACDAPSLQDTAARCDAARRTWSHVSRSEAP